MKLPKSKTGITLIILLGLYVVISFPWGFITIGLPWTLLLASINVYESLPSAEIGFIGPLLFYVLLLVPAVVNAFILYWIGVGLEKFFVSRKK